MTAKEAVKLKTQPGHSLPWLVAVMELVPDDDAPLRAAVEKLL